MSLAGFYSKEILSTVMDDRGEQGNGEETAVMEDGINSRAWRISYSQESVVFRRLLLVTAIQRIISHRTFQV